MFYIDAIPFLICCFGFYFDCLFACFTSIICYEFKLGFYELQGIKEDTGIEGCKSMKLRYKYDIKGISFLRKPALNLKVEDPGYGAS